MSGRGIYCKVERAYFPEEDFTRLAGVRVHGKGDGRHYTNGRSPDHQGGLPGMGVRQKAPEAHEAPTDTRKSSG